MKDVVVSVRVDDKPEAMDELEILVVSTDREKDAETYTDLSEVKKDWEEGSRVYKMVSALFNQGGAQPSPGRLIRKVKIVGLGITGAPEEGRAETDASGEGTPEEGRAETDASGEGTPEEGRAETGASEEGTPEAGTPKELTPDELVQNLKRYAGKDNSWYIFLTDRTEDEYIEKLSEFAQDSEPAEAALVSGEDDHRKIYFAGTSSKSITGIKGRSVIVYTDKADECIEAAYLGAVAPWYPRHVTWKFKMPQGITAPELTAAEINDLDKNHINYVSDEYKNNYIKNGVCADGEWIDSVLGGDWIARDMRNELYKVFVENAVVPYTDDGFNLIGMAVFRTLNRAVQYGIIASDSDSGTGIYRVSIPARSTASEEQIRNRIMPDITWEAQLEGAVHGIMTRGILKVNL